MNIFATQNCDRLKFHCGQLPVALSSPLPNCHDAIVYWLCNCSYLLARMKAMQPRMKLQQNKTTHDRTTYAANDWTCWMYIGWVPPLTTTTCHKLSLLSTSSMTPQNVRAHDRTMYAANDCTCCICIGWDWSWLPTSITCRRIILYRYDTWYTITSITWRPWPCWKLTALPRLLSCIFAQGKKWQMKLELEE